MHVMALVEGLRSPISMEKMTLQAGNWIFLSVDLSVAGTAILAFMVPIGMFLAFRFCCVMMRRRGVQEPPIAAYAVLFLILDGWILAFIMPYIGPVIGNIGTYLIFDFYFIQEYLSVYVASLLAGWVVIRLFGRRNASIFHKIAFWAAATYTRAMLIILAGWLSVKLFVAG
jgi:hypothetical protein